MFPTGSRFPRAELLYSHGDYDTLFTQVPRETVRKVSYARGSPRLFGQSQKVNSPKLDFRFYWILGSSHSLGPLDRNHR
jgi:hypothetical protein